MTYLYDTWPQRHLSPFANMGRNSTWGYWDRLHSWRFCPLLSGACLLKGAAEPGSSSKVSTTKKRFRASSPHLRNPKNQTKRAYKKIGNTKRTWLRGRRIESRIIVVETFIYNHILWATRRYNRVKKQTSQAQAQYLPAIHWRYAWYILGWILGRDIRGYTRMGHIPWSADPPPPPAVGVWTIVFRHSVYVWSMRPNGLGRCWAKPVVFKNEWNGCCRSRGFVF